MIYPDRVRLLKENGKHTTVPYTRLSGSDQNTSIGLLLA